MQRIKSFLDTAQASPLTLIPLVALLAAPFLLPRPSTRPKRIPPSKERVLILGASSGVGRVLATLYAARGARVCLVARRGVELGEALEESVEASGKELKSGDVKQDVIAIVADASDAKQMFELRARRGHQGYN